MTDDERRVYQRGYSRGYNAGSRGAWPDHRPPAPPDPIVAKLVSALMEIRNAVDTELALLEADDEWTSRLGPKVDAADEALTELGQWVKTGDEDGNG